MYLYQTTGIAHPTVTFAATGSACAARLLFDTNADLLDDVDPFIKHDNMVEYVHPLDPWGNSMLGVDNGDQICFIGNKQLEAVEKDPSIRDKYGAYSYCSMVYGWPGPSIIAAQAGVSSSSIAQELRKDFQRCRYFTHMAESILLRLDDVLLEDGATDGGCHKLPTIPRNDPEQLCPVGSISRAEEQQVAVIVLIFLLSLKLRNSARDHRSARQRCVLIRNKLSVLLGAAEPCWTQRRSLKIYFFFSAGR